MAFKKNCDYFCFRFDNNSFICIFQNSGWRKLRTIVQWTPFFQTYKKQRYPWVQLAGHQGNFKAGPDQGTILKKLCPKEETCFQVLRYFNSIFISICYYYAFYYIFIFIFRC